jgi:hypothetical protein
MRRFAVFGTLALLLLAASLTGAQAAASITITSPAPGAILPNLNAITVTGTGTALFENSLTVQALDAGGGILAQQPVTTNAPEVGGTGTWQVTLSVSVTPGTGGTIRAFATSANDGSLVAEAIINVIYGSSPQPASIAINQPPNGTVLPNSGAFLVSGTAANLFEGNVVVQARDAANNVLAEQATIASGGGPGSGSWQVNLSVNVANGTAGTIRAFSPSASGGGVDAEAVVNVTYGAIPPDVGVDITLPLPGAAVDTTSGVIVTGTTLNIPDGNVTVQLRDGNNRLLAERRVKSAPTQGTGNWQASLNAFFTVNSSGSIVAFAPGVGQGGQFPSDTVFVTFLANCAVRTDWPIYVVQRGDILNAIAQRVGSSAAELARANCLNNPNLIEVGQPLRVPRLPAVPATATPRPSPAIVTITAPQTGALLDPTRAIPVTGTASGLGSVTVQALDAANNVLAAQTVVVSGTNWQANLTVGVTPGTTGRIAAFATSPQTGSVIASASVNVTYGTAPVGTPGEPLLQINLPLPDAALNTAIPVVIGGIGANLFEGNVVVRVLDNLGGILAEQPATLDALGNWTLNLMLSVQTGTRGTIYAYSPSAEDGSVIVADAVNVVFGAAQPGPFVTITEPLPYTTLDPDMVILRGRGGALFEGNVVVRALDSAGNILIELPTTVNAADVGGEGDWEISLNVPVRPGTRGTLEAYAISPADGSIAARARVPVTFGQPDPAAPFVRIVAPLPGAPVTAAQGAAVSGYAGGASEITVQIIDANGSIYASRSLPVDPETGLWQTALTLVAVEPGTGGRLIAFASGAGGTVIASDGFDIIFAADEPPAAGPMR